MNTDDDLAIRCALLAHEQKADDIVILDVAELLKITDHFVIMTALNTKHVRSLAEELRIFLKTEGPDRVGQEGMDSHNWVLLDYGDLVIHIFDIETRKFYDLEMLWGDAPHIEWEKKSDST